MISNNLFWEKHKDFFLSRFHPEEHFLCAEKLARKTTIWSIGEITAAALITSFVCVVCLSHQVYLWFAILFLTTFAAIVLTYFTAGLLSQEYAIITTKAVYYCRGRDCELVFECRYAEVEYVHIEKKCVTMISAETYNSIWGPWGIPNVPPLSGRCTFLLNRFRKLTRKQPKRKFYRFTKLCVLYINAPPRQYFLELDLKENSEIPKCIKEGLALAHHIELTDETVRELDK